jgi:RpiR family carbohydrate utilization transcriptional regulator
LLQQVGLIVRIKDEIGAYTPSYKQIAHTILMYPKDVKFMSVATVAELSKVSTPTVVRFCRLLGFEGFREFKLRLAEEEGLYGKALFQSPMAPAFICRMGSITITAIEEVIQMLACQDIDEAIGRLANAKKIEFWGQCASAAVAQDAYNKFFAVGIPCYVTTENTMQRMSAALFSSNDVIVAISHTGINAELIKNIELAKRQGAFVLGISLENSPVAKACTRTISINITEKGDLFSAMVLRVAHIFVLDTLAVGVLLRKGALQEGEIMAAIEPCGKETEAPAKLIAG